MAIASRRPTRRWRVCLIVVLLAVITLYLSCRPERQPFTTPHDLVAPIDANSRFAIVTFLGSDTLQKEEDMYFVACRLLTYQLLHAEETRIRDRDRIDWVVAVTSSVDAWKRAQLRRDGARVVEVEDIPLRWWISTGVKRWKDQFTKLRLLQWTSYARVLFLDADTLLLGPLDDIFHSEASVRPARTDLALARPDEAQLPAEYVFLAAGDHQFTGKRQHAVPPVPTDTTGSLSAGFWLAAPSAKLFDYLMSVMAHFHRFDPQTMEQSLLNYAFRRCDVGQAAREASALCPDGARPGPMPWRDLEWRWSSTWPSHRDVLEGVVSLHEKLWKTGPNGLRNRWVRWRKRMEEELGPSSQ